MPNYKYRNNRTSVGALVKPIPPKAPEHRVESLPIVEKSIEGGSIDPSTRASIIKDVQKCLETLRPPKPKKQKTNPINTHVKVGGSIQTL